MAEDFVSMRVSTLRGDQKINFDVYVKINEKMILYLRRGDSFEGLRLKRLKEKKLKKMYIQTQDEDHYRKYLQSNIELAYDDKSGKDIQTRTEIVQGQQQTNTEEVFDNPGDAVSYKNAKDMAGKYVNFLLSNTQAISSVMNIENVDKNVAHHGVSVATLAVALADRLKTVPKEQTQILALGALLHDFGHYELNSNLSLADKDRKPDDIRVYRTHPRVGSEKVKDEKHFDQQVLKIIYEHEECIDGSGYPRKLSENKLDPLSVIVSTANALDRFISFEGVPRAEAAKKLMLEKVGKHPLNQIQILGTILKENI